MRFAHLAQRLFNTPIAIRPEKAEVVMAALADRLGISKMIRVDGTEGALSVGAYLGDEYARAGREQPEGYSNVAGVAVIQVSGTLVQKLGTLEPYSGMTGYDGLRQNFLTALNDPDVKAIALQIDSPGGEVAGCFDLVDTIFEARGEKPITAILDESAYSAAYAIASAADEIYVPRTGGTGSIGVISMHVDWSKALTDSGVKVTFITYGDRKADGHAEIPLSDEAHANFKADITTMGELFVETVARNRGIAASAVRATQAGTFLGERGVKLGLADAVMPPDAAFQTLLSKLH